jgi:hypothetical protein
MQRCRRARHERRRETEGGVERDVERADEEQDGHDPERLHAVPMSDARAGRKDARTTSDDGVPSSTTCVATSALAMSAQKSAATSPAWIAVSTTSAVEPCRAGLSAPGQKKASPKCTRLFQHRAGREELKGEREGVHRKEPPDLDSACERASARHSASTQRANTPTAARRRPAAKNSPMMRKNERPETTICAMFPSDLELSPGRTVPARAIPHCGAMPTGADVAGVEKPARRTAVSMDVKCAEELGAGRGMGQRRALLVRGHPLHTAPSWTAPSETKEEELTSEGPDRAVLELAVEEVAPGVRRHLVT